MDQEDSKLRLFEIQVSVDITKAYDNHDNETQAEHVVINASILNETSMVNVQSILCFILMMLKI